ncbi:cytochrome P450 [Mycobacterium colombiense]
MNTITAPDPYPPGITPPWTTAGHADPVPWFVTMAAERPLSYDPQADIWHFTGHGEVANFLKSCDDWSVAKRLERVPPAQRVARLLTTDPPTHGELRGHFRHAYRPRRVQALEDQIRSVCRELLDKCLQKPGFDVTADFAAPLTATMISHLLGVPETNEDLYLQIMGGAQLSLGKLTEPADDDERPTLYMGGSNPEGNAAQQDFFIHLIEERRKCPMDDLISDLARIPSEQFELRLDVGALLSEQLGAGQHTTTHLLGSMIYLLDRFPDQQRLLRSQPELIPSAIEESLRYSAPLQARPRLSTRPLQVGEIEIPEGATGLAWLQAANFDPRRFDDPTRFDITRSPNHHIAFGLGEHFCLGAPLARVEARVAMEELLGRTDWIARTDIGEPPWVDDFILRGPASLAVEVVAAGA